MVCSAEPSQTNGEIDVEMPPYGKRISIRQAGSEAHAVALAPFAAELEVVVGNLGICSEMVSCEGFAPARRQPEACFHIAALQLVAAVTFFVAPPCQHCVCGHRPAFAYAQLDAQVGHGGGIVEHVGLYSYPQPAVICVCVGGCGYACGSSCSGCCSSCSSSCVMCGVCVGFSRFLCGRGGVGRSVCGAEFGYAHFGDEVSATHRRKEVVGHVLVWSASAQHAQTPLPAVDNA